MARDAEGRERVVFDLVDDGPGEHDAPVATSPAPGPATGDDAGGRAEGDPDGGLPDAGAPLPGGTRQRLRVLAPVAAVLAVALGTGFAVDGVRAAERIERIREVPGGVVDVSLPLEQTWAWEGQVGSDELGGEILVADLQGALAFQSESGLVGLDPASGEEVWSVSLGEDPECGPAGYPGATPATSSMVCLQGDAADRAAVVVGAGGVVSEPRALDAADERRYGKARPGPEGTVLRAQRVGPESMVDVGDARCTEDTGECNGTVEAGRDLVLRAEDATTGEERWTATVPFRATAAQDCTPWYGPPWNGWEDATADEPLAPEAFGAQPGADLIDVWGCGVTSTITSDGALLRAEGTAGSGTTVSLGGGRYATVTPPGPGQAMSRTTLFASDGSVVGEIREYANPPRTTDEPDRTTLFASGSSGGQLRSYAADGSLRWDVTVSVASGAPELLAQVDGTLVTSSWTSGFQGLDLATGAERWSWEPRAALGVGYDVGYVSQVFTDGRSVLLPLQSELGAVELVALDATSGELGWNRPLADVIGPEQNAYLVTVDGHLLAITPEGVRGLG